MSDKLKPCPFCGKNDLEVDHDHDNTAIFHFVFCHYCETYGPVEATREESIIAWNKRGEETVKGEDDIPLLDELAKIHLDPNAYWCLECRDWHDLDEGCPEEKQRKQKGDYRKARGVIPWHEGMEKPEIILRRFRDGVDSDLLSALENLVKAIDIARPDWKDYREIKSARAAIAKAKGKE